MNIFDWLDAAGKWYKDTTELPTRENLDAQLEDELIDVFVGGYKPSFDDAIETAGLLVLAED